MFPLTLQVFHNNFSDGIRRIGFFYEKGRFFVELTEEEKTQRIAIGLTAVSYTHLKVVYAAKRMGQGEFDYRLENMGEDEIGQIGLAFNQLSDQIQELIRENYEKKIRIQTSELNLLQEQINPHFLYNALAVISALAMREGGKQTMQAVKNLSSFYRISLNKGKQVLSIQEEVELLQSYLKIQQMRFRDSVQAVSYTHLDA